jgi:hypothetical protein
MSRCLVDLNEAADDCGRLLGRARSTSGATGNIYAVPSLDTVRGATGYGLACGTAAAAQATVATLVVTGLLGLETSGRIWRAVLIAVMNGLLGVSPSAAVSPVVD